MKLFDINHFNINILDALKYIILIIVQDDQSSLQYFDLKKLKCVVDFSDFAFIKNSLIITTQTSGFLAVPYKIKNYVKFDEAIN